MTNNQAGKVCEQSYAIARDVKGFVTSSIRVKIVAHKSNTQVLVITADIGDVGTFLILSPQQLEPETTAQLTMQGVSDHYLGA